MASSINKFVVRWFLKKCVEGGKSFESEIFDGEGGCSCPYAYQTDSSILIKVSYTISQLLKKITKC